MVRSALSKAAWVGRTASMVLGLALVLALVVGLADAALGANGQAWVLGQINRATATTQLNASVAGKPALLVTNPNKAPASRALHLNVAEGRAPMAVNSDTRVANLNADKLDGKDFSAFDAREVFDTSGPLPLESSYTSKGGTLILSASGSGFRGSSQKEGLIGMNVFVDGIHWGLADVFANERNSHKAFVAEQAVISGLPARTHTIRLEAVYASGNCNTASETQAHFCTVTDRNDRFMVTVVEIPD